MRLLILTLSIVSLIAGCDQYSTSNVENDGRITINALNANIDDVEIIPWQVGADREQEVSKGIRIKILIPLLEQELIKELANKRGIDSWVIFLKRRTAFGETNLATLLQPILTTDGTAYFVNDRQVRDRYITLYYSAAAHSKRYESIPCPAFEHNYLIEDADLTDSGNSSSIINVSFAEEVKLADQPGRFGFHPSIVNGGSRLAGEYTVTLVLFDSVNNIRKSSPLNYSKVIRISNETTVKIVGCNNYKIPEGNANEQIMDIFDRWK